MKIGFTLKHYSIFIEMYVIKIWGVHFYLNKIDLRIFLPQDDTTVHLSLFRYKKNRHFHFNIGRKAYEITFQTLNVILYLILFFLFTSHRFYQIYPHIFQQNVNLTINLFITLNPRQNFRTKPVSSIVS